MICHKWRIKPLVFFSTLAGLLLASLFLPLTAEIWRKIDTSFFRLVNDPLKGSPSLRVFWALANHSLADWVEDLCILGFYLVAIWKTPREHRLRRGAEFIFCLLLTALTILLINRLLCRDLLQLRRASPTLVLDQTVNLSHYISWIQVKVDSAKSLPGDHATTALLFAFSYAYIVRGRLALIAILYGIFLCLPRLVVGAHWLSDILIGSGSIVLISLSFAFFSPLANRAISIIEKRMKKIWPRKISTS